MWTPNRENLNPSYLIGGLAAVALAAAAAYLFEPRGGRRRREKLKNQLWRGSNADEWSASDDSGDEASAGYYGEEPERYGAGNYDAGAYGAGYGGREYSDEYSGGHQFEDWRNAQSGAGRDYGARRSSFNDRWQNSYAGSGGSRYAGHSRMGGYGGDHGRDSMRQYEGSLFTGGGSDRLQQYGGQYGGQGAEGQFRGRGPKGYRRSDERIREDACECLMNDECVDATSVDVRVQDCEVTLTGTVNSRDEKRRAEDLISRLPGVKDVRNQLRVTSASGVTDKTSTQGQTQGQTQGKSGSTSPSGEASMTDQSRQGSHH